MIEQTKPAMGNMQIDAIKGFKSRTWPSHSRTELMAISAIKEIHGSANKATLSRNIGPTCANAMIA